ncbi:MAG: DUF3500 domain-containing protein [Phycisphaerales bacterium]|nr:DUF3500 domain-containing protein [Phycisphaerales bacterium]
MRQHRALVLIAVLALPLASAVARLLRVPTADPMRGAATAFLASLSPEHRGAAELPFGDPNRLDWHYVPRARRGLALKDMSEAERVAAHRLLQSALSSRGYLKTTSITGLETVLRQMAEARGQRADYRDPMGYFLTVFGDPAAAADAPCGWRFEGHHVSLNFTSVPGESGELMVTPMFLGANPAEVREGDRAGVRVLAQEEDLARRLLSSLDEAQRAAAVLETDVPGDILMSPGNDVGVLGAESGLAVADMSDAQKSDISLVIAEWAGDLRPDLAAHELDRIRAAGIDRVRLLWIGSTEPGRPCYYRLRGPTFVIEYDCTQDGANHIHTVWRDPERDFGGDPLREHLAAQHR